jgi:hypothetical protein
MILLMYLMIICEEIFMKVIIYRIVYCQWFQFQEIR